MNHIVIPSPIGHLSIHLTNYKLSKIEFVSTSLAITPPQDPLIQKIQTELTHYFQNPSHKFHLEFQLTGTPFQKKVWDALQQIPANTTMTYSELAKKLKTGARAIGNACRKNPIPIVIPCHRVVAKHHIGGYAGETDGNILDIKKWLLAHENC